MALQFQPPPDWLVQNYIQSKQVNPAVETLSGVNQVMQQYAQQKALQQQQAAKNDETYIAAFTAGGPDLANQIASRRGIKNPPVLPSGQPPVPSTGTAGGFDVNASTPVEMNAQQSMPAEHPVVSQSPLIQASLAHPDHAKALGYQAPSQEQVGSWMNQGKYGQSKLDEATKAKALLAEPAMESVMTHAKALEAGAVPKGTRIVEPPAPRLDISEHQSQFDQREWDKIVKDVNPATASTRTTLGMATKANFQADRALVTLSKPVVTVQEAGNAMADIAAIYQMGSPTQYGMSHQEYSTLYGKVQGALQSVTGKPQDALPDAIKQRLIEVLHDMKGTNAGVLKQQLDFTEKSKAKIIKKFPDEWKDIRMTLEGSQQTPAGFASIPQTGPHGPSVNQNGHTYNWNPRTGQYE